MKTRSLLLSIILALLLIKEAPSQIDGYLLPSLAFLTASTI